MIFLNKRVEGVFKREFGIVQFDKNKKDYLSRRFGRYSF